MSSRAEVRLSFITTTVREESQVTPQGRHWWAVIKSSINFPEKMQASHLFAFFVLDVCVGFQPFSLCKIDTTGRYFLQSSQECKNYFLKSRLSLKMDFNRI